MMLSRPATTEPEMLLFEMFTQLPWADLPFLRSNHPTTPKSRPTPTPEHTHGYLSASHLRMRDTVRFFSELRQNRILSQNVTRRLPPSPFRGKQDAERLRFVRPFANQHRLTAQGYARTRQVSAPLGRSD